MMLRLSLVWTLPPDIFVTVGPLCARTVVAKMKRHEIANEISVLALCSLIGFSFGVSPSRSTERSSVVALIVCSFLSSCGQKAPLEVSGLHHTEASSEQPRTGPL